MAAAAAVGDAARAATSLILDSGKERLGNNSAQSKAQERGGQRWTALLVRPCSSSLFVSSCSGVRVWGVLRARWAAGGSAAKPDKRDKNIIKAVEKIMKNYPPKVQS